MSARTDDGSDYTTVGVDAPRMERYADLTTEDGDVLVYDQDNEDAWIQSDTALRRELVV